MFGMLMLAVLTLAVPLPFCFVCCWCYAGIRQQEAQAARAQTDGYKLDKNHTFKVSMFDDFDRYAKVPDVYAAPEIKEYSAAVSEGVSGSWVQLSASLRVPCCALFLGAAAYCLHISFPSVVVVFRAARQLDSHLRCQCGLLFDLCP